MSIMLATLLTLVTTNGPVNPTYKMTTTCDITGTEVLTRTTGPLMDFPRTIHKQVKFNREIPNANVLLNLISDVESIQDNNVGPAPIGGGRTLYIAHVPGTSKQLALKSLAGKVVYQQNNTPSAQKLVRFLSLNCK
ncbi:MAG: hypothetical protein JST80_13845 [Bdellovibrionales bacterium]|nr:hypothetical protein [Bdellovibrionales bacterium]